MLSKYWAVVFLQPSASSPAAKVFNAFNSRACLLVAFKHWSPQTLGKHGCPSVLSLIWSSGTSINKSKTKELQEWKQHFPETSRRCEISGVPKHNHIKLVRYICTWHIRTSFEIALAPLDRIQSRKKSIQSPLLQKRESSVCLLTWPVHRNEWHAPSPRWTRALAGRTAGSWLWSCIFCNLEMQT